MSKSQIGIIGLATMGANLARNFSSKKIPTIVYNRTYEKTENLIKNFGNSYLQGSKTLKEFAENLEKPRKIILLVKAGDPVDEIIEELKPFLDKNDVLLDCGNSFFQDTGRRESQLANQGIYFIGCGISGGEEGALKGPSLMPGGDKKAYTQVSKYLAKVAAQDFKNGKCVTYLGPGGSGHFVKMVHNGIEYGIMQLIAEAYDILRKIGKFSNPEIAKILQNYSKNNNLKSFLLEITAKIFAKHDGSKFIIDYIKDSAGQKGTGRWTTEAALNLGVTIPTINAAVDARILSGDEEGRKACQSLKLNKVKTSSIPQTKLKKILAKLVEDSLELSIILTYEQGMGLLRKASSKFSWNLDLAEIVRIWQGGCIIRSGYLKKLEIGMGKDKKSAQKINNEITKLFAGIKQQNWRKLMSLAIEKAIPIPSFSATLGFHDAYIQKTLPQNLIQAQRDFFGAHCYERKDKTGNFHTEW